MRAQLFSLSLLIILRRFFYSHCTYFSQYVSFFISLIQPLHPSVNLLCHIHLLLESLAFSALFSLVHFHYYYHYYFCFVRTLLCSRRFHFRNRNLLWTLWITTQIKCTCCAWRALLSWDVSAVFINVHAKLWERKLKTAVARETVQKKDKEAEPAAAHRDRKKERAWCVCVKWNESGATPNETDVLHGILFGVFTSLTLCLCVCCWFRLHRFFRCFLSFFLFDCQSKDWHLNGRHPWFRQSNLWPMLNIAQIIIKEYTHTYRAYCTYDYHKQSACWLTQAHITMWK